MHESQYNVLVIKFKVGSKFLTSWGCINDFIMQAWIYMYMYSAIILGTFQHMHSKQRPASLNSGDGLNHSI